MTIHDIGPMLRSQYEILYSKPGCPTPDVITKELVIQELAVKVTCEMKRVKSAETSYFTLDTTTITVKPPNQAVIILIDSAFTNIYALKEMPRKNCPDFHHFFINDQPLGLPLQHIKTSLVELSEELLSEERMGCCRAFFVQSRIPIQFQIDIFRDETDSYKDQRNFEDDIRVEIFPWDDAINQEVCDYFKKSSFLGRCNWDITHKLTINEVVK